MRRNPKALRNTAFHESGHAASAFLLGVQFRFVSIRPDQERGTVGGLMLRKRPKWAWPDTEEYNDVRARTWFEKMAQISLAGQVAESKHAGRRPAHYSHATDNDHAREMAMEIYGSDEECDVWMELILIRARNQLDNFWPAVEALAEELLKRGTIAVPEVRQIILNAMCPPGSLPKIETIP
jgi:hypothetical protein